MAESGVYANAIKKAFSTGMDWLTGTTWKAMLVQDTAAYTADLDSHDFFDDVSAKRAAGADDVTIATTKGITLTAAGNYIDITTDTTGTGTITFESVTTSASACYGIIIYRDTGTPGTSPLLCYNEFSNPAGVTPNGSDIQVNCNAAGIIRFTAAAS